MKGCNIGNTGAPLDSPECFGPGSLRSSAEADSCRAKDVFHEDVGLLDPIAKDGRGTIGGALSALPGCNPIQPGPQRATKPVCPVPGLQSNIPPAVTQQEPAKSSTRAATVKPTSSSLPGKAPSSDSTAPGVKLPSGWTYSGCFSDNIDPRSLGTQGEWWGEAITSTGCVKYCSSIGKAIAGTEHGGQCFCGNELKQSKPANGGCNMPCAGDGGQICGGSGNLSIFRKSTAGKSRHRRRHDHPAHL